MAAVRTRGSSARRVAERTDQDGGLGANSNLWVLLLLDCQARPSPLEPARLLAFQGAEKPRSRQQVDQVPRAQDPRRSVGVGMWLEPAERAPGCLGFGDVFTFLSSWRIVFPLLFRERGKEGWERGIGDTGWLCPDGGRE